MPNILTLSRPGGGTLNIHPAEWQALQNAVAESLALVPVPEKLAALESAITLDDSTQAGSDAVHAAISAFEMDPESTVAEVEQALRAYIGEVMTLAGYQAPAMEALPGHSASHKPSPLGDLRPLEAEFTRFAPQSPLDGHYHDTIASE